MNSHPSELALVALALRDDTWLDRFEEDRLEFSRTVQRVIETMHGLKARHGCAPDVPALRHALRANDGALSLIEDARCTDVQRNAYDMHRDTVRAERIKLAVFELTARYGVLNDPFAVDDPETVVERLSADVARLAESLAIGKRDTVQDGRGMVMSYLDELESRSKQPISTGFKEVDNLTGGGFRPGQMIIIGAYTGVGKSALLTAMTSWMTSQKNYTPGNKPAVPVLIISIEMTAGEVEARILARETGIPMETLMSMRKIEEMESWRQQALLAQQKEHAQKATLFCDDSPDTNASRLRGMIRRQVRINHVRVVFIDYIQLLRTDKRENRVQELDDLSRELKVIAKELNVTIICLAQLSRAASKDDRKPRLSDLRESGGLEANANIVILLSRRSPEEGEGSYEDTGVMPLLLDVAKNRAGRIGEVKLGFNGETMAYEERE